MVFPSYLLFNPTTSWWFQELGISNVFEIKVHITSSSGISYHYNMLPLARALSDSLICPNNAVVCIHGRQGPLDYVRRKCTIVVNQICGLCHFPSPLDGVGRHFFIKSSQCWCTYCMASEEYLWEIFDRYFAVKRRHGPAYWILFGSHLRYLFCGHSSAF